jgi:hypothetical protein
MRLAASSLIYENYRQSHVKTYATLLLAADLLKNWKNPIVSLFIISMEVFV